MIIVAEQWVEAVPDAVVDPFIAAMRENGARDGAHRNGAGALLGCTARQLHAVSPHEGEADDAQERARAATTRPTSSSPNA